MPGRLADYLGRWDAQLSAWDTAVTENVLFAVGRGASLAAAQTGALIVKEAAKAPMEAMSAPQFRHGPLELADGRTCIIVLAGAAADAPANDRLVSDLLAVGASVVRLPATSAAGPLLPAASLRSGASDRRDRPVPAAQRPARGAARAGAGSVPADRQGNDRALVTARRGGAATPRPSQTP